MLLNIRYLTFQSIESFNYCKHSVEKIGNYSPGMWIKLFKSLSVYFLDIIISLKINDIFVGDKKQARSSYQQDRAVYFHKKRANE